MTKIFIFSMLLLFHSTLLNGEGDLQNSEEFSSLNVFVEKIKQNPDKLLEILEKEQQILTEDFITFLDSNKGLIDRTIKTIKIINSKYYYLSGITRVINTINQQESIHYTFSITDEGFNALNQIDEADLHRISKDNLDISIQFRVFEGNSNYKWLENNTYLLIGIFNSSTHFPFKYFEK